MKNKNLSAYDEKYALGYGVAAPEGHVIRINKQILQYELKRTSGKMLDFGCGTGTHSLYFANNLEWVTYGCDTNPSAIKQAKQTVGQFADNYFVTDAVPDLGSVFSEKFDFIFANQVLYYLEQDDLEKMIVQFENLLNPGGIFFASMMDETNYYYSLSESVEHSFLRKVTLTGRLNEQTHINFKNRDKMLSDFSAFKKLHCGYYDTIIREDEGSTKHIWFLGQK